MSVHKPTYEQLEQKVNDLEARLEKLTNERHTWSFDDLSRKYKSLYENTPLAYQSLDANGNIMDVNPAWLNILGYERSEVIGRWFGEFLHPDFVPHFQKNFPAFKKKGVIHDVQFRMRKKDGNEIYVSFEGCIGYDEKGDFKQTYCTFKDITDYKQTQEKLKQSFSLLELILESTNNGILVIDNKGKILKVNNRFSDLWNIPGEILLEGKDSKLLSFIKDQLEQPSEFLAEVKKLYAHPEEESLDYVHFKDGRVFERYSKAMYIEDIPFARIWSFRDISARKKAEQDLKESNAFMRRILDNLPVGVVVYDTEFNYLMLNKAIEGYSGMKSDEIIGRNAFQLFPYLKESGLKEIAQKALNGETVISPDYKNPGMPESEAWFYSVYYPNIDSQGNIIGVIALVSEITERKLAEKKIIESEARYKAMFNDNKSVMILLDSDTGDIVDANDAALDFYGYTKEELTSMKIMNVNPMSREEVEEEMRMAHENRRNFFQFKHQLANGDVRDVQAYGGKIKFKDRELLYSVIHDNTNEKLAEKKLKEQNEEYLALNEELNESMERLQKATEELKAEKIKAEINELKVRSILSAIPDLMFVFNEDGVILDFHAEQKADLLIEPEIFLHKKVDDVLPSPLPELTHENISRVLSTGDTQEYGYELEMNGVLRYFESRMVLLDKEKALSIVRDVTASKKVQKDLIIAKERAEESDRLKSAFLANMSHEIRTPMNGIIGFSEMLANSSIQPEKRNYYTKIIIDSSKQLLNIVNDILDISMIESDSIKLNYEPVVVNDVIMDIFTFFKPQANNKTITLHSYKALTDEKSVITTDKARLKQVLTNLLNNAFKFTATGFVKFGYHLIDDCLQFYVEDSGIGIAHDQLQHIFERFRQEDSDMTREYGGTGLGLSISQKLVELLGGQIWVESEKGKGSVFYFTLPYHPVNQATEDRKIKASSTKKAPFTVLLAEDEEVNHMFIQEILTDQEVELLHARNGREAVAICNQCPEIGLVLMDIKMPEMNGYEAIAEIKKTRPELPIIAQTAYAMTEDREKALNAGCVDYLAKPVDAGRLQDIVAKYRKQKTVKS